MNKYAQLEQSIIDSNGYLFVSDLEKENISRTYISKYIKENKLERVAKGIHVTKDTWPDQLYIIQRRYPQAVFFGETALDLHQMLDREYQEICVSLPKDGNGMRLRSEGVRIRQTKDELYQLGISEVVTNYGHMVRVYDRERCICDLVKHKKDYEPQTFRDAMRSYINSPERDAVKLVEYAEILKIREKIMDFVEVFL